MFGYFRPYHANLTHTEQQLFNAYYCRICYCLRILGGQTARFCTTYDAAVYSLILQLQQKDAEPPALACERIGTKNFKYYQDDQVGLKFARLSLISFGEKFRDDRLDHDNLKTRIASTIFSKAIQKAKEAEPQMAKNSFDSTERINALQDANAPLPEIFAAYGDMAVGSFSCFAELTAQTEELIRSVSEWVFLVDMVCDYADDYKSGAYNGFKTEGLTTFSAYFDYHYTEFLEIANAVTERLVTALLAVRDGSTAWKALYKIIIHATDTVIPSLIAGEDVSFHYFRYLAERIGENKRQDRDIKRLGIDGP